MKRLLLVAYYYPPLAGPGVFRPLRLSKYLPRQGWEVTVLTVSGSPRAMRDASLLAEIPAGVEVVRAPAIEPRAALIAANKLGLARLVRRIEPWLMLPDDQRGWVPFASRRGTRLVRERQHHAMLTTAGPYSTHLVGLEIQRRTQIPWVADFRDEWTTNPYLCDRYPTAWHRRYNEALEARVLERADRVTCVSAPWLDALRSRVPSLGAEKFHVLPNGYDAEHFPRAAPPVADRFRIVYTGTFYGHRSPAAFFEAVRRVLRAGTVPREMLEIVLVGHRGSGGTSPGELEREGILRVLGSRPYFESLAALRDAAVLLLVIPREGGAGNHTGKLFNYLASGRPILALAPEPNVAATLIRESASGVVAAPEDPEAIAAALAELYAGWQRRSPGRQDRARLAPYEAGSQARDWAALLDDLTTSASSSSISRRETTRRE